LFFLSDAASGEVPAVPDGRKRIRFDQSEKIVMVSEESVELVGERSAMQGLV